MRATTRHGHAPCPATPRLRPTACAVLWKVLWKVLCTFLQKYFVLRTVSCIRQFRPVSCVRALRSCHSPYLMFPSSPRTVASGKRGGHPSNRAPPTPDAPDTPESIAAPADALEQSRNPSSAASNDGGNAVQANVHPDVPANEASEWPSDTADLASACSRV